MNSLWQMGGYAAYVWPAYGITFLGLIGAVLIIVLRYERVKVRLKHMVGEEEGL